MLIDPANDKWVWAAAAVFLVMMGVRAWVAETGQGRLGRTPAKVRIVTATTVASLGLLIGLMVVQGGAQLADALLSGTDPAAAIGGAADVEVADPDPAGPDAAVPGAGLAPAVPVNPAAPAG